MKRNNAGFGNLGLIRTCRRVVNCKSIMHCGEEAIGLACAEEWECRA